MRVLQKLEHLKKIGHQINVNTSISGYSLLGDKDNLMKTLLQ